MSGSWSDGDNGEQTWSAAKATDLLLMGLASCAAHDVVSIMERQRQQLTSLRVEVDGLQQASPPFCLH